MAMFIVSIMLNCILAIGSYLLDRYTPFKKLSYIKKQIIIGVAFGGASAFASSFGVNWLGTVVNVRDAAPLSAGLIFGAPAGIIAGFIGGLYRWFSVYWGGGTYTRIACSLATILAGFMAAALRKWMFDNKKPNWAYGIFIAVACEVFHMILIFITNMGNSSYAFEFVKGATLPMIIGNAFAVGFSTLVISFFSKEGFFKKKSAERIANTFQRWLLICIAVAFLATSAFTYVLQNGIVKIETQEVFTSAINDVANDIQQKSDAQLLDIARRVKGIYEDPNNLKTLEEIANDDQIKVKEINVVDKDGKIIKSNHAKYVGVDMNEYPQSKEFVDKLKDKDSDGDFVQAYMPMGLDNSVWRKYAAVNLTDGGFVQVGYDTDQFHVNMETFVIDVTKNRHVGTGGFVIVCDSQLNMIIDNEYDGKHISLI